MEIWKSWLMNWNPSIVQFVTYPLQNSSTVYENSLAIILTMTLSPQLCCWLIFCSKNTIDLSMALKFAVDGTVTSKRSESVTVPSIADKRSASVSDFKGYVTVSTHHIQVRLPQIFVSHIEQVYLILFDLFSFFIVNSPSCNSS